MDFENCGGPAIFYHRCRHLIRLRIGPERPEREQLVVANAALSVRRIRQPVSSDPKDACTMQTIVLATQKGGSGKSTLAIGLALAARQAGHIVRLIETDRQGTLSSWQRRRGIADLLVETIYDAIEIEARLLALARHGVTLAIIDTASGTSAATTAAIRHADYCIIPARPSVADIEASAATLATVRAWQKPFAFVLNQTPMRGHRINA